MLDREASEPAVGEKTHQCGGCPEKVDHEASVGYRKIKGKAGSDLDGCGHGVFS
jgi:hypothetical protein